MADEAWRRSVECTDAGGRQRELTVMLDGGRLLISTPPGEFAVITLTAASNLKKVITEAQIEASTRGLSQP